MRFEEYEIRKKYEAMRQVVFSGLFEGMTRIEDERLEAYRRVDSEYLDKMRKHVEKWQREMRALLAKEFDETTKGA